MRLLARALIAAVVVAPAGLLLGGRAHADRVITEDGRILFPKRVREEGEGYRLVFEHGEIVLPTGAGIRAIEIEGDMSDYVPQNEDEAKRLAQGFVRYRGRWLSKPAYETELRREFEAARERADEIAKHSSWHDAWEKETRRFLIRTNTSPELLEYYAELLEAYYAMMNSRVGINPTPTYRRKKMTVNIYKSASEFRRYSAAPVGAGVLGYFWAYDDTLNFYHDYQDPSLSEWVALHECTHLLTFLIDQQYRPQIWLNEAIADYFGSAEIGRDSRGRIQITPGQIQTDRVLTVQNAIKEEKDIKLEDLFFITRDEFSGFEYAHAWSFVYFLNEFDGGKYQRGFQKFFRDLYTLKGVSSEVVNTGTVTGTGKVVRPGEIRDFLLKQIRVRDLPELEQQWKDFIAAIPIESAEARLRRGIRSCREGKFEDALPDLDAAIAADTRDPRAYSNRCLARLFTGDRAGARTDAEKAVEIDPLSAGHRYLLSLLLLKGEITGGEGVRGGGTVEITTEGDELIDNPASKAQAGLATELDPDNDLFRRWYESFE